MASALDGRVTRGQRNRQAIIDALLACYEAGSLRPSVDEVAARAGLSAAFGAQPLRRRRSVAQRGRAAAVGAEPAPWRSRVRRPRPRRAGSTALIAYRADLYEAVTPVRRAALLTVHDSPADRVEPRRGSIGALRRQLEAVFPDLDDDTADALDAALSWDTWNRLRTAQRCSAAPRAAGAAPHHPPRCSKGARHEWDPPEQGAVHRARERARRPDRS